MRRLNITYEITYRGDILNIGMPPVLIVQWDTDRQYRKCNQNIGSEFSPDDALRYDSDTITATGTKPTAVHDI